MERIKGQEVEVMLVVGGRPIANITALKSFDLGFDQELKKEGYLGETTNRYDTVFNGIEGKLVWHLESRALLDLAVQFVNISRRRLPNVQVNIKATLNFPTGRIARVVVPDVRFGKFPLSFGSRTDYVDVSVDYGASEALVF